MLAFSLGLAGFMLVVGVPVFAVLLLATVIACTFVYNIDLMIVITQMVSMLNIYILLALPMFMLAGFLMIESRAASYLVDFFEALLGHFPGGLALSMVVTCGFFGALSGSTLAAIVAIGGIMLPRMKAAGYSDGFAAGLLAVSSLLAMIIPPSNFFILYCAATETPVGRVFAAGIVPGIILMFALVIASVILPQGRVTVGRFDREKLKRATIKVLPVLGMPIVILGTIFSGVLTAVEAGAMAALYIVIIDRIFYRQLKWPSFWSAAKLSITNTAMIYLLLAGVGAMVTVFMYTGLPTTIANLAKEAGSTASFIVLFLIAAALLGAFLDAAPTLYILAIMLFTTAMALGIDPIHFGVFLTLASAMGMATPPMSVGLYASASVAKISPHEAIPYALYFVMVAFMVYFLIAFFPGLSLWAVNLIYG
ncbi:MAG: TRAP transporter large permease [Dehalococcoidales bacterium]|nr:TRAP transporter large permease [Dehalococcoidales bacterium]